MTKTKEPVLPLPMTEVAPYVWVGSMKYANPYIPTLYCCKSGHTKLLGYKPMPNDPYYLSRYNGPRASLNIIDSPKPDYMEQIGVDGLVRALDWLDAWNQAPRGVQIVCDMGRSRSAAIACLYLANARLIPDWDPEYAERDFIIRYPWWDKRGTWRFIAGHWTELMGA